MNIFLPYFLQLLSLVTLLLVSVKCDDCSICIVYCTTTGDTKYAFQPNYYNWIDLLNTFTMLYYHIYYVQHTLKKIPISIGSFVDH